MKRVAIVGLIVLCAGLAQAADRPGGDASPTLAEWIQICIKHLGSDDAIVRQGASLALRAAGNAAHPALETAAAGSDPKIAQQAKTILGLTQRTATRRAPKPVPPKPLTATERIVIRLGLEESQVPKVLEILDGSEASKQTLIDSVQDGKIKREDTGKALAELDEKVDREMAEVLTEEQMKRYRGMTRRNVESRR